MKSALAKFQSLPLKDAARQLLTKLGYTSEKFLVGAGSKPQDFLGDFASGHPFDHAKALVSDWKSADLLFQLTDQELSRESALFTDDSIQRGLLKSYIFVAIELKGTDYARGKFSAVARQINRLFPMPVMVIFKHGERLTIAVINRRRNKIDESKDVLEKATLIRDITFDQPHRGHLDILASLALPNLVHPEKKPITDFDTLHAAWEQIFNIELLNDEFYRALSNWYFWAMRHVHFPPGDIEVDKGGLFSSEDKVREHDAKNLIRLLTRLLFVWFIKEKKLVPSSLFHPTDIADKYLKGFQSDSKKTRYYKAILQNLFFATLNQVHGKREFRKEGQHQNTTTLLRYESMFRDPAAFIIEVENFVPFLNGGLFECLDHPHPTKKGSQGGRIIVYEDGFSDRPDNPLVVPDFLFFGAEEEVNLSEDYGDTKRRKEKVSGLIHILDRFKFTIVENTPIDQEIALDPELLGKVFENLLASYNPETKTTARKQTGSFYTPRPIVDYMVDESLKAHLCQSLVVKANMSEGEARARLDILFAYTEKDPAFSSAAVSILIEAIDCCNILDPACGSGAFPMGMLHKLVHILAKLDPNDRLWKQRQFDKVDATIRAASEIDDATIRESTIADLEAQKDDIEEAFERNELGYGRKLFLIENCIYGVDIQPIATQVSKLRFFISLVVDQTVESTRDNFGIRPLPNLETKFVTADTLIQLEKPAAQKELFELADVSKLQKELKTVRHNLFSAKTPRTKEKYRARDKELREAIAAELQTNGWSSEVAGKLARWDPYNQNASVDYFDPEWMFDRQHFDIVVGNPPYGASLTQFARAYVKKEYKHQDYQLDTYLLFLERGISLLREGGIQSVIVPNTWLPSIMFKSIRRFIFGQTRINSLVDIRTAVFTAVVDNNILTHTKCLPDENRFPVIAYTEGGFEPLYTQQQSGWHSDEGNTVSVALTPKLDSIAMAIKQHKKLDHFFAITPGCKPYQVGKGVPKQTREIVSTKPFTSERRETLKFRPLLRGRLITKYKILWNHDLWINFGEWLAEPRESAQYDAAHKIVIRQTGDSLIAALDSRQFVVMNNMFTIVPHSPHSPLRFALAAINSSVLNWYYQNCINPEKGEALAEVKKGHLTQLPLPVLSPEKNQMFDALVRLVTLAKVEREASPPAAFVEDLIDACVMECYFREHMAERDLLFQDTVAPHLAAYDPAASDAQQRDFLNHLHQTLNAPSHPIRSRLLRLSADSPDLLAVIKAAGRE